MHVDEQQILSLSRDLWSSHLGLSIQPGETSEADAVEKTLSSCIKVSGPWQGTILLECSESVVRHAAAMLFEADGVSTSDEDIADALKELADMVGKKMRSLLPESSKLSRPVVADEEKTKSLLDLKGLSDIRLSCEGRPVRIVLLEAEAQLAATGS